MPHTPVLLHAKLSPPRPPRRALLRPALIAQLRDALDYRLTLVQAGTGYGKSTALAALLHSQPAVQWGWYNISEADVDPQQFLAYLIAACRAAVPALSDSPAALLQEASGDDRPEARALVLDALINALAEAATRPVALILDDYHFIASAPAITALLQRFLTYLPAPAHVILATRHPPAALNLIPWKARGEVLEVGREALAFKPAEIETLFRETYGLAVAPADVERLAHITEGWPIALQLVWQGLRDDPRRAADWVTRGPASPSLHALFDFLAHDVLGRQPADIRAFLRDTAPLRELTPAACEAVAPEANGETMLARLHDLDLFVVALGEKHYRYNHLFHDFLREQWAADPEGWQDRHRRAAAYFRARENFDEAIYHRLAAHAFAEAAADMEQAGEAALRAGRLDTVARWIDALPADVLAHHPRLQVYVGDTHRLRSQFDEALAWYAQAEQTWRARGDLAGVSRALRGQALVYLDTVRPTQAQHLLEEALRVSDAFPDRQARARLLELLAENKLNMGKPSEAEQLRAAARTLREEGPGEDALSVRVRLRTGRLAEAQHILEQWAEAERREAERGQVHPPRAHRETVLILSLIHALRGQAQPAFALAQEGIALGEKLNSPFTTAVGHIRLGHAWQVGAAPRAQAHAQAVQCYQTAIALGDQVAVRRTRAEALWGLTRAHGFFGDLDSAQSAAREGAEIARAAGDLWMAALIELALGASYFLAGRPAEAVDLLLRVLVAFRECGDSFGRAATRLWLSLAFLELGQGEHFASSVEDLLTLCETHGYDFLFAGATLLGPPEARRLAPVLLEAQARRRRPAYAAGQLAALGLGAVRIHPGYQLRVQTLGGFRVWRGEAEVDAKEWKRDKARQLFQLLLTQRRRAMQREEITEQLWPGLTPEAAARDFKVALNALNKALEPARSSESASAYITREGATYALRPEADVWLDAAVFEQAAASGLRALNEHHPTPEAMAQMHAALALYTGDYLPEALYEDWVSAERERLLALYLRVADKLAGALVESGAWDEALRVCQLILARDACWERAYRLMMTAHVQQGNRPQALRVYQRCVDTLRAELAVEPSPATVALQKQIAQTGALRPGGV